MDKSVENDIVTEENISLNNKILEKVNILHNIIYFSFILMILSGLIIFLSADKIVGIFSDNPIVIDYGTNYLKISALIVPAYPIFFISNGFFMAIKKSKNSNTYSFEFLIPLLQSSR